MKSVFKYLKALFGKRPEYLDVFRGSEHLHRMKKDVERALDLFVRFVPNEVQCYVRTPNGDEIRIQMGSDDRWSVRLYPKGKKEENKEYVRGMTIPKELVIPLWHNLEHLYQVIKKQAQGTREGKDLAIYLDAAQVRCADTTSSV